MSKRRAKTQQPPLEDEQALNAQPDTHAPDTSLQLVGPLIPQEHLAQMEAAIALLPAVDEANHQRYLRGIRGLLPVLARFDNLLDDASGVLEGDTEARQRFITALFLEEMADDQTSTSPMGLSSVNVSYNARESSGLEVYELSYAVINETLSHLPETHTDRLIPDERVALLTLAAAYADIAEPGSTHRYLSLLNHQFGSLGRLEQIWIAAQNALKGDDRNLGFFKTMIDQISLVLEINPDLASARLGIDIPPLDWPPKLDLSSWKQILDRIPGSELKRQILERYACQLEAYLTLSKPFQQLGNSAPVAPYIISAITPLSQCPGMPITITGSGFGNTKYSVSFPVLGMQRITVIPQIWTDTRIEVNVPQGTICGDLGLNIPAGTVTTCGQTVQLTKPGSGSPYFDGSETIVMSFTANGGVGSQFAPLRVEPNDLVTLAWKVCPASTASVSLQIWGGGNLLFSIPSVQPTGTYNFTVPNYNQTRTIECALTASNPCTPAAITERIFLNVHKLPNLRIDGVEITQGLQYYHAAQHLTDVNDRGADNSLQLVEGKPAYVRVYIRSGQDPNFNTGQVTGVDGLLDLYRTTGGASTYVDRFQPVNPGGTITAWDNPAYAIERGILNSSLNFIIPAYQMHGRLTFTLIINPSGAIKETDTTNNALSITVDVSLQQSLRVAGIMIGYNGPNAANTANLNLPAPTQADLLATLGFSLLVYPVASTPQTRVVATITQTQPLNDVGAPGAGGCSPNWDALFIQCVQAKTNDGNQPGQIYCALLNNGIPIGPTVGCGGGSVAIFPNGAGPTAASENGHALGLLPLPGGGIGHAPVQNPVDPDPNYPAYEPYDPANTPQGRIGEYGLNINNGNIMNPLQFFDIMSAFIIPNMWMSLYTFKLLVNNAGLNPVVQPVGAMSGGGGAMTEMLPNIPEPIIDLIGYMDDSESITLISVARVTAYQRPPSGVQTDLFAQLVDEQGRVLAAAWVYAPLEHSHNEKLGVQSPFHFVASLRDVKGAAAIIFLRHGKEVYRRAAPSREPVIPNFRAEVINGGQSARLSWELEHTASVEPIFWLQASNDNGEIWRGVTVGLYGNEAEVNLSALPGGNILLRLLAHDGFYTSTATTQITLPLRPPEAVIFYPKGDTPQEGTPVRLWGVGTSAQEGTLIGESLAWSSDRQGELGRGEDLWINNLEPGIHQIRLEVADSTGLTGYAQTTLTIQRREDNE